VQKEDAELIFYIGCLFIGGTPLYRSIADATVRILVRTREMGLASILAPLVAGLLYHYQPDPFMRSARSPWR
jgi:hypothetical protein